MLTCIKRQSVLWRIRWKARTLRSSLKNTLLPLCVWVSTCVLELAQFCFTHLCWGGFFSSQTNLMSFFSNTARSSYLSAVFSSCLSRSSLPFSPRLVFLILYTPHPFFFSSLQSGTFTLCIYSSVLISSPWASAQSLSCLLQPLLLLQFSHSRSLSLL